MNEPVVLSTGTSTIVVVKISSTFITKPKIDNGRLVVVTNRRTVKYDLPAGQYSILGWSDEISEEQAQKLFRRRPILGHDYFAYKELANVYYTALECLASFLTANNIERELLLIKI